MSLRKSRCDIPSDTTGGWACPYNHIRIKTTKERPRGSLFLRWTSKTWAKRSKVLQNRNMLKHILKWRNTRKEINFFDFVVSICYKLLFILELLSINLWVFFLNNFLFGHYLVIYFVMVLQLVGRHLWGNAFRFF
jgi:hypothetical protein